MTERTVAADAYAVVRGTRNQYQHPNRETGLKDISGATIKRIVQNAPVMLNPDEICVKIRIVLPAAVFDPLMPSAVITVPEDLVQRGSITVEAIDTEEDE